MPAGLTGKSGAATRIGLTGPGESGAKGKLVASAGFATEAGLCTATELAEACCTPATGNGGSTVKGGVTNTGSTPRLGLTCGSLTNAVAINDPDLTGATGPDVRALLLSQNNGRRVGDTNTPGVLVDTGTGAAVNTMGLA